MADSNFCSRCGARLDPQARFCASCGSTVAAPAVAAAPPPPQYQPAAAPAPATYPPPAPQAVAPAGYPQAMPQQYGAVPPGYVPQTAYAGLPPGAVAMQYAGFWMRVGAYLLDVLILIIPLAMLSWVPGINIVAALVGPWLYYALQESSERQATLGKLALKIYVTDLQGQRISFGQATGRHFGRIICVLTLGIGYMMAGFTAQKQGLHDMIAGTLVKRK